MPRIEHAETAVYVAADVGNVLGESPIWSAAEKALYWTDIRAPALFRLEPKSGRVERWDMPELAGAVMLGSDGGIIVGLQSGLYTFSPASARLRLLHRFEGRHPDDRTNDSRCDRQGRLWFSIMRDFGRAPTGAVFCLDSGLNCAGAIRDVTIPNGLCFSPDGGRMYFADTPEGTIKAYADLDDPGALRCCGTIVPKNGLPGKPDGATVDAHGHIWSARFGGGCVVRSSPDGETHVVYPLPVSQPTSCTFGGPDLDRLFITTARQGLSLQALEQEALSGSLLVIDPGVKGIEEGSFLGV